MDEPEDIEGYDPPYIGWNDLDFSVITMGVKWFPFFKDDLEKNGGQFSYCNISATDVDYGLWQDPCVLNFVAPFIT